MSLGEAWEHVSQNHEPEEANPAERDSYDDPLDRGGLEFARRLLEGYQHHEAEIDQVLGSTIQGWSFGQMAKTDLAVLRLAAYEMLFEPTPYAPLIEVAVKIAKRYGGEDSGRFVNGVLGRLLKRIESGEIQAVEKEK